MLETTTKGVPKKLTKKEAKAEEKRLRLLVKDGLYPLLLKHATSIKDAKTIVKTLEVGMDAVFMQKVKEYQTYVSEGKLAELKLADHMNDAKQYPAEHAITALLDSETVSCARSLISGLSSELDRLTDEELKNRPLDTLKTEWL